MEESQDSKESKLNAVLSKHKQEKKEDRYKLSKALGFLSFSKLDQLVRGFGKKLTNADITYTLEYNFAKLPPSMDGGDYELGEIFFTIYEKDNPAMLFTANFMDGIFEILTGTYEGGELGSWTWNKVQKVYDIDELNHEEIEGIISSFLTQSLG
jgi:hypothetical protein